MVYRNAYSVGLKFNDLDNITVAELNTIIENHREAEREKLNAIMYGAWHSAAFERSKKMPKLEKCLLKEKKSKPIKIDDYKDLAEKSGVEIPKG